MSLLRLLQALTLALVLLSAAMLGLGHQEAWFVGTIAIVAIGAFTLNDLLGWFYLHRFVANAAMLATAFLTLNDFFGLSSRDQLIAIGELLVYVQLILLLQKKTDRIYGQVAIFSLLAVVVAALLTHSLAFGVLVLAYTFVGVFTMSLFSLYRMTAGTTLRLPRRRRREPLFDQIRCEPLESGAQVANWMIRLGVLRELAVIGMATILFGSTFFYSLPRIGGAGWEDGGGLSSHRIGFSPEITFDQMGKLLSNDQLVMRVTFRDLRSGSPYVVITEPYFRGAVLSRYIIEGGQPKWRQDRTQPFRDGIRLTRPKSSRELIAVDTLLEPTEDSRLFYIYPPYATRNTPDNVRFHPGLRVLYRESSQISGRRPPPKSFRFEIATTAFRFGLQTPVTPHFNPAVTEDQRRDLEAENRRLLRMRPENYDRLGTSAEPEDRFPGLRKIAREVIERRAPNGNVYAQAMALQNWFLEPGLFTYTIDAEQIRAKRNPKLDPIEDFVVNHRHGHCQYFASALALMLRSVGIPARLVVGYRGGEFNFFGHYYLVRQSNAHAWVEAYMPEEVIPANAMDDVERHAGGGWLRLDPTPAADANLAAERNVLDRMNDSLDYAQWLWSDYVLNLTRDRQRAAGMTRIESSTAWDWTRLLNPQEWQSEAKRWWQRDRKSGAGGWSWWQIGSIAVAGAATAFMIRFGWPWKLRSRRKRLASRAVPTIEYYRRLERLLRKFGYQRDPSMTPRELAAWSGRQIGEAIGDPAASGLPNLVVEAYYQDRFRPEGAPPSLVAQAAEALEALERVYRQWRERRPKTNAARLADGK